MTHPAGAADHAGRGETLRFRFFAPAAVLWPHAGPCRNNLVPEVFEAAGVGTDVPRNLYHL